MEEFKEGVDFKKVTIEYTDGATEVYDGLEDDHKSVVFAIVTVDNLDKDCNTGKVESQINASDYAVDVLIKKLKMHLIEHGDGEPTLEDFMEMFGM